MMILAYNHRGRFWGLKLAMMMILALNHGGRIHKHVENTELYVCTQSTTGLPSIAPSDSKQQIVASIHIELSQWLSSPVPCLP